jgi:hypothetical protein
MTKENLQWQFNARNAAALGSVGPAKAQEKRMEQGSALLTKTSQTAHGVAASDCAGFVEVPGLCDKPDSLCTVNEIKRDGAFGG